MQPIVAIPIAAAAAALIGWWLRRNLATLSYRYDDELNRPDPGQRWWVIWVTVAAITSLTAAAALRTDLLSLLPLLPLAISGAWLAAVDSDVNRIPNRVLIPVVLLTAALVLVITFSNGDTSTALLALLGAAIAGGTFAVVHFATKGGIGFGDAKLAAAIGLSLGHLGLTAVLVALLAGSIVALIWAGASKRRGPFAYGPWLLLGAWLVGLVYVAGHR